MKLSKASYRFIDIIHELDLRIRIQVLYEKMERENNFEVRQKIQEEIGGLAFLIGQISHE